MHPDTTKKQGIEYLLQVFEDRQDTDPVVLHWLFIRECFCYIEKCIQGQEYTFRLKDTATNQVVIKMFFEDSKATITEVSIDPALDNSEYVTALLFEIVTEAINTDKTYFLIKGTENTYKQSFLRALIKCGIAVGGRHEKGVEYRKYNLVKSSWPISPLTWAKKSVNQVLSEQMDDGAYTEVTMCRVVTCLQFNGVYYFMIQEDLGKGRDTTFIVENKRGSTIFAHLHYDEKGNLKIYWNGLQNNMHRGELYCAIMDRILTHALAHRVRLMDCRFETPGELPEIFAKMGDTKPPKQFPNELVEAMEMYGFIDLVDRKLMSLQLGIIR